MRLLQPQQMMAESRHVVEEAYAGDIIGVFDPGIFSIGDTICRFQEYFGSVVTSTYNFDMMFARSRRLESQFDILMEILDEGIIGINERAEIFAMNKKAEEITGLKRSLVLHKQASSSLAYLPLLQCLKSKEKIEPKVIRINGVNVGVTVVPVLRKDDCIGAFAFSRDSTMLRTASMN